jgi:phosphatidylglycerophosphate synthase
MSVVGLAAAALLSLNGLAPALGAVLLIQLQLLLDCSDGELARVRGQSSPAGIYLDRIGHYLTEAALPIGLGIRADGGWHSLGGSCCR